MCLVGIAGHEVTARLEPTRETLRHAGRDAVAVDVPERNRDLDRPSHRRIAGGTDDDGAWHPGQVEVDDRRLGVVVTRGVRVHGVVGDG